jgi:Flp pilus assembly pilin Flp
MWQKQSLKKKRQGNTLVEYSLILAILFGLLYFGFQAFGKNLYTNLNNIGNTIFTTVMGT